MKLHSKLLVTYLFISFIPLILVSLLGYANFKDSLLDSQRQKLEIVADYKEEMISNYFNSFRAGIHIINDSHDLRNYLSIVSGAGEADSPVEYVKAKEQLDEYVFNLLKETDVENVILVNQDETVIYATDQKFEKQKINELFPIYGRQAFENGRREVFLTDLFTDFILHSDKSGDKVDFLVSAPVRNLDGIFSGVVMFEVEAEKLFDLIQSPVGLGETGEVLIVRKISGSAESVNQKYVYDESGDHVLFLNPLRFDKNSSFKRVVRIGSSEQIPPQEAAKGVNGSGNHRDYRNMDTFSVFRYLPGNNWGMVVKIDMEELLRPANLIAIVVMLFIFTSVFVIFLVSWLLAKTVSDSLIHLTAIAKRIGQGDWGVKFGEELISTKDEVGILAKTLASSVENLQDLYRNLEKKVKERTGKLEQSEKELEKSLSESERINRLMSGRELKMMELKKEIQKLKQQHEIED